MKTELIENIAFTKEDYIQKTTNESMPSFDELLDTIVAFVEENGGSLEDAVDMANVYCIFNYKWLDKANYGRREVNMHTTRNPSR